MNCKASTMLVNYKSGPKTTFTASSLKSAKAKAQKFAKSTPNSIGYSLKVKVGNRWKTPEGLS